MVYLVTDLFTAKTIRKVFLRRSRTFCHKKGGPFFQRVYTPLSLNRERRLIQLGTIIEHIYSYVESTFILIKYVPD